MANTSFQNALIALGCDNLWPLDDAALSATARNIGSRGVAGTIVTPRTTQAPGLPGGATATAFDGTAASRISLGNGSVPVGPLTYGAWIRLTTPSAIVLDPHPGFVTLTLELEAHGYPLFGGISGRLSMADGDPHLLIATMDANNNVVVMLDGVVVGSGVTAQTATSTGSTIGFSSNVGSPAGVMGNVFTLPYALNPLQGAALYAAITPYQAAVLADGPVGFWPLDDDAGSLTARDLSGNGYVGTTSGTAIPAFNSGVSLPGCRSALFTEPLSTIHLPNGGVPLTLPITLEGWFEFPNFPPILAFLFGIPGSSPGASYTGISASGKLCFVGDTPAGAGIVVQSSSGVVDGKPHHLVVTLDAGNNLAFYVDGQPAGTATGVALGSGSSNPSISFANGQGFTGYAANLAAYPTVLSATRVAAHFNAAYTLNGRADGFGGVSGSLKAAGVLAGKSVAVGASLGTMKARGGLAGKSVAIAGTRGTVAATEGLKGVAAGKSGSTAELTALGHLEGVDAAYGETEGGLWVIPTAGRVRPTVEPAINLDPNVEPTTTEDASIEN